MLTKAVERAIVLEEERVEPGTRSGMMKLLEQQVTSSAICSTDGAGR
jgi:hypothetical protein